VIFRKLSMIIFLTFTLSFTFPSLVGAVSEETQIVYDINYGGLRLTVFAPVEANPGENITITVKTTASDVHQIFVNFISLKFYGAVNATSKITLKQITHLSNVSLTSHHIQYNLTVPEDISPGLILGEICCDWKALSASFEIPASGFPLTYVKNVGFEQLQTEYNNLNVTHQSLVQNYTELKSDYTELKSSINETDSAHSLMYVFIATTVVSVVTIIVLLMRRPKRVWA